VGRARGTGQSAPSTRFKWLTTIAVASLVGRVVSVLEMAMDRWTRPQEHDPMPAAAAALQRMRQHAARHVDSSARSRSGSVHVVSVGIANMRRELPRLMGHAHELLSVGLQASGESLYANHRATVAARENGLQMVSLFDYDTAADTARTMLATLSGTPYYFCRGTLQMKILDRRMVLLEGPNVGGERSLIAVTDPRVLTAALRYWAAVTPTAVNAADTLHPVGGRELTARQREIAGLMTADLTDDTIARLLGVSVRTVRTEIAAIMRTLHVRTRFSAGLRLGQHGFSVTARSSPLAGDNGAAALTGEVIDAPT
jgi:DNA-binding NarL/FixJ family response regulator